MSIEADQGVPRRSPPFTRSKTATLHFTAMPPTQDEPAIPGRSVYRDQRVDRQLNRGVEGERDHRHQHPAAEDHHL